MLETYLSELYSNLSKKISVEDATEVVGEARSHLTERADQLRKQGLGANEAEARAIGEFGVLEEMTLELAEGYPPKPPVDPKRLAWIPEIAVAVIAIIACMTIPLHPTGPNATGRAAENVAQILVQVTPMFIIPGMFGGLARLKYRRLKPLALQMRMANYGLAIALGGAVTLGGLELTGRATLESIYPMEYGFCVASIVCYTVMKVAFSNGKLFDYVKGRLKTSKS